MDPGLRDFGGISVVIPTYNSIDTLPRAIRSVLDQTHSPVEVLVVDDGGSDATAALCGTFRNRVRYIRQENAGASAARNTGVASSTGEWLAFLDADDAWDPEKLELQAVALRQHPDAACAMTPALCWSEHEQAFVSCSYDGPLDPIEIRRRLLIRNVFTGLCSSILIRREALASVGGFARGKGCEDRRLAIELLARFQAVLLEQPLIRQYPGPAHWRDPRRQRVEMLRFIRDYEPLYAQLDPTGRLRRQAFARVHERTGMHYLENGDLRAASRNLARAALLNPLMPNPWRVLVNACLGRLKYRPALAG